MRWTYGEEENNMQKIRALGIAIGANILLSAFLLILYKGLGDFGYILICGLIFRFCNILLIIELLMLLLCIAGTIRQHFSKEKENKKH